jgi:hypothetical protein
MNFIIKHRLQWLDMTPTGPAFSNPDDMKVLYNDWPYGIDSRIIHLVVWVKFDIADDPISGFLTQEANGQIQRYVDETFSSRLNPDHVCSVAAHCLYRVKTNEIRLRGSRIGKA